MTPDRRPAEPPVIRRATPVDADAAADVFVRSRRASFPAIPREIHTAEEIRGWMADHVLAHADVWLAETPSGEAVAVMAVADDWIDALYIVPEWTGRGLGTRLLDVAKAHRPGGLQLWTFESNVGAQQFYERHGFVAEERTDGRGNEEGAPDIRYAWRPEPSEPLR
jgi:GNAT superfamily N-acetyltransferase